MLTSRVWIISSGLVGAISLMLRSAFNFSLTGARFFPPLNRLFLITGTIIALAASDSLFRPPPDHPTHHDDHHDHYDDDDHHDGYNTTVEDEKFISPEILFPSTVPEKPTVDLTTPPSALLKTTSPLDDATDENETIEEMWKKIEAETHPTKPSTWQGHVISKEDTKPSPRQARKPPPPPPPPPGMKLMERIPTWGTLKKELSMGKDELNSRVEAFINKFKNEMKLQRLESLGGYKLFRGYTHDR